MYGTMSQQAKPETRKSSMFGPIVLIGLGILFLLSNLNVIDLNFWELLFRFWPVFLIAAGLDILLGRRSSGGPLIGLMLILGLIFGAIWLGYIETSTPFGAVKGEAINQSLAGAARASVSIESNISQMQIGAGAAALELLSGDVTLHPNEELTQDFGVLGGMASYIVQSGSRSLILPNFGRMESGLWNLQLNRTVPIDLQVSTGIGSSTLDLTQLNLSSLSVETGIGEAEIALPARGDFDAIIKGGVGGITIYIPPTMAAQIEAATSIGTVRVVGDYTKEAQTYTSPDYQNAANRVHLTVEGSIGAITVEPLTAAEQMADLELQ